MYTVGVERTNYLLRKRGLQKSLEIAIISRIERSLDPLLFVRSFIVLNLIVYLFVYSKIYNTIQYFTKLFIKYD